MAFTKDALASSKYLRTAMQPFSHFYDDEKSIYTSEFALSTPRRSYRYRCSRALAIGLLPLFAAVFFLSNRALAPNWPDSPRLSVHDPFELQRWWAQYSPFFPVKQYESPPRHCNVIQV